jgi:hypothetical protein
MHLLLAGVLLVGATAVRAEDAIAPPPSAPVPCASRTRRGSRPRRGRASSSCGYRYREKRIRRCSR